MTGLSFIGDFVASRVLDIQFQHVLFEQMNYLGLYGTDLSTSELNSAPGESPTAVVAYQSANMVFGSNYMASSSSTLSAGFNSTGQPRQLDATLFCAFNSGATGWVSGTDYTAGLINLWGDDTRNGGGRMTVGLHKTAAGDSYIVLLWGTGGTNPPLTCAIPFDWTTATGPIFVAAARDTSGGMRMEVRNAGQTFYAAVTGTPIAIPETSLNWRGYVGQLSTGVVTGQRIYAAAIWSAAMTAAQLSAELDVMQVNLATHLA
ncbi:hypothetical protein JK332_11020 [Klebsiella michiganensis]|uniref:hypothetical protein n=1 Tax=Klebsiella michiganensis TaxID=1134687 RepID=UPI00191EF201|nr:hypothetical protein [Klebsiella michiganensis]MBL0772285.1 hypothetical protein [Klebsiella michiganensis]